MNKYSTNFYNFANYIELDESTFMWYNQEGIIAIKDYRKNVRYIENRHKEGKFLSHIADCFQTKS